MIGTEKLSLKQRDGRAGSGRVGPGRAAILISHRPNYKTLSLRSLVMIGTEKLSLKHRYGRVGPGRVARGYSYFP